jgi:hypothetical protein
VIDDQARSVHTPEGSVTMLTARENMDVIAAYEIVGTFRGAAVMCSCDRKTVKRKVEAHRRAELTAERKPRLKPVSTPRLQGLL